ncbi:MAG: spore coat protein U domain-containing protein [Acidithiobacillus sp.]
MRIIGLRRIMPPESSAGHFPPLKYGHDASGQCLLLTGTEITQASTAATTFTVTANVAALCKISATNLNFGKYMPSSGAVTGNFTISGHCTNGTKFTLALNDR